MKANHSSGAVSDADLIRYLDGELDADESERVEAAIAVDDTVAGRLAVLSRRDRNLSGLLRHADPSEQATRAADPSRQVAGSGSAPAPGSRGDAENRGDAGATHGQRPVDDSVTSIESVRSRRIPSTPSSGVRWLRAAIIIFALFAGGMLVPPVRAWIVDRLDSLVSAQDAETGRSPDMPSTEEGAAVSYGLTLDGPVLEVTFDAAQAEGRLEVVRADGETARIEPLAPEGGDPVLVTVGSVRIRNAAGSSGGYRLTLPRSVTALRVRFGGGAARMIDIADRDTVTLELNDTGA